MRSPHRQIREDVMRLSSAGHSSSKMTGRRAGQIALVVVFALFSLNALAQAVLALIGRSDDPALLSGLQVLVGTAAAVAAWGSWKAERWAPLAAMAYGLITAAMIVALGPILDLDGDARRGLWGGAAGILVLGVASAWYLRWTASRKGPA